MRNVAAVMTVLYVGVVAGLAVLVVIDVDDRAAFFGMVTGFFLTQALFLFGSGPLQLQRPVRGRRLLIPAAVGALLMAMISGGMAAALVELYYLDDEEWVGPVWIAIIIVSWVFWGGFFSPCTRKTQTSVRRWRA